MSKREIKKEIINLLIGIPFLIICIIAVVNDKIGTIIGAGVGIIIFLFMIAVFAAIPIAFLVHYFKKGKWYMKVATTITITGIALCCLFGITMFFSVSFEDLYEVEEVKVMDVRSNKLFIDYTKYNNDDYKVIEIHKPFYAQVKEGDTISVRYPENHPEKMHYIIGVDKGLMGFLVGTSLFFIGAITAGGLLLMDKIRHKKGHKKR